MLATLAIFRVWVVHVSENVNLYPFIQKMLIFFNWIQLVLVMFSPVSMATNGKD